MDARGLGRSAGKVRAASHKPHPIQDEDDEEDSGEDAVHDWWRYSNVTQVYPGEGESGEGEGGEQVGEGEGEGEMGLGFTFHQPKNQQVTHHQEPQKQVIDLYGEDANGTFFRPETNLNDRAGFTNRSPDGTVGGAGENVVDKMLAFEKELLGLNEVLSKYNKLLNTDKSKLKRNEGNPETIQKRIAEREEAIKNTLARKQELEQKITNFLNQKP